MILFQSTTPSTPIPTETSTDPAKEFVVECNKLRKGGFATIVSKAICMNKVMGNTEITFTASDPDAASLFIPIVEELRATYSHLISHAWDWLESSRADAPFEGKRDLLQGCRPLYKDAEPFGDELKDLFHQRLRARENPDHFVKQFNA
eukprot:gene11391-13463_t